MIQSNNILVIDDDNGITEGLCALFEDEGYIVNVANNGERALKYLAQNTLPDVILLDLMMPVMDGYSFRSEQLKDPNIAKIPVIVMTASTIDGRVEMLNANSVLRKPLDVNQLMAVVEAYSVKR